MKNITLILALTIMAVSCSKKESTYVQDSNTMLEEPAAPVTAAPADTAKKETDKTAVATPAAKPADTAAVKK